MPETSAPAPTTERDEPRLDPILLAHVACCLEYPRADTVQGARQAAEQFEASSPAMAKALRDLARFVERHGVDASRERYITLFELDPVCTLNMSWHLWGDTYDRGAFLAEFARELKEARLDPGDELPDFLPTMLRMLERINDLDDLRLLTGSILLPALERMIQRLGESEAPWSEVLRALPEVLGEGRWISSAPAPSLNVLSSGGPEASSPCAGGCPHA